MPDLRYDFQLISDMGTTVDNQKGARIGDTMRWLVSTLGHTYRADEAWAALWPVLSASGIVENVPAGNGWGIALESRWEAPVLSPAEETLAAVLDHLELVCEKGDGGAPVLELVESLVEIIDTNMKVVE